MALSLGQTQAKEGIKMKLERADIEAELVVAQVGSANLCGTGVWSPANGSLSLRLWKRNQFRLTPLPEQCRLLISWDKTMKEGTMTRRRLRIRMILLQQQRY